jgi:hypothetical protein
MNEQSTDQLGRLMARVESLVLRIESVLPQPLRRLSGVTRLLSLPQAFLGHGSFEPYGGRDAAG